MTIRSATPDKNALTLTLVLEFPVPPERTWQLWSDPRQLERWYGPPTWPATFTQHELVPGGRAAYYMTGPEGQRESGWWTVIAVDEPNTLVFEDGFADAEGKPSTDLPVTRSTITFEGDDSGTTVTIVSTFASSEQMQQLLDMGVVEGTSEAFGQIDGILAEG